MERVIINENQRGLQFKNGKFDKLLLPGSYWLPFFKLGSTKIELLQLDEPIRSEYCAPENLITKPEIAESINTIEVPDGSIALHYYNGNFREVLTAGSYSYFKLGAHRFKLIELSEPQLVGEPLKVIDRIPSVYYTELSVGEYERGRLYFDGKFVRLLEPGRYFFWNGEVKVACDIVSICPEVVTIKSQELLTSDKISVRLSYVFTYTVVDPIRLGTVGDYLGRLHTTVQLAMRDYVSTHTLDEILTERQGLSDHVFAKLKEKSEEIFVEISDAGVKDIILPGEISSILNTVLIAEKRAQANVITRREEVASTRSLLNTAKLMDENKTLYRLKELEYLGKICEQVGSITLSGQNDVLSQLSALIGSKEN